MMQQRQIQHEEQPNDERKCWLCSGGEDAGELIEDDSGLIHASCHEKVAASIESILTRQSRGTDAAAEGGFQDE